MCREWTRPPAARAVKRWAGMEMDLTITGDQANDALTGAVPVVLLRRYRERHAVLTVHGRALGSGGTLRAVEPPRLRVPIDSA